jgi:hypothetical protein
MNFDLSDIIIWTIGGVVVLIAIAAMFITGRNNGDQFQEYRLACIEAGGTVVSDNCIYPRITPLK